MKKVTITYSTGEEKEFVYDADTNEKTIHGFLALMETEIGLGIDKVRKIKWETLK